MKEKQSYIGNNKQRGYNKGRICVYGGFEKCRVLKENLMN